MTAMSTAAIAERVLRKHFTTVTPERYGYPEVLSLHGAVNLALTTGLDEQRAWVRRLLKPFLAGALTHRMGAYWLYNIGGTATAKWLYQGSLSEFAPSVSECAELLITECPRGPRGFLAYQTGGARSPDEVWIDMVFATCPFLVYAGLHFDRDVYLQQAVDQLVAMHHLFLDPGCGLYHQAINVRGPGELTDDHWSRGNGWAILALAEVAANLPASMPSRDRIVRMLDDHLAACLEQQDSAGMWHQEMTEHDSYVETSGTGLILYALGLALEHGLCHGAYRERLLKGLRGYAAYIALDGSIHNCCMGCMCPGDGSREAYRSRPWRLNDPHAFGPAGLAFGQAFRIGITELDV